MLKNVDKVLHFIGIGGIGMSGLAEILHTLGFKVQGSDKNDSYNIARLQKLGIRTFIGHDAINVQNVDIIVYSSAIKPDNIELLEARRFKIPCLSRAEMLSQLVRLKQSVVVAGSHGKTTVTSLSASLLEFGNFNPTVINGGIINSYGSNAKLGIGDWAVIESDESDGSFTQLFPTIAIVTNIDHEHLYYYKSFQNLKNAFKTFLNNLPFYGAGIVCIDDPTIRQLLNEIQDRNIITYGLSDDAQFQAVNIRKYSDKTIFDVICHSTLHKDTLYQDVLRQDTSCQDTSCRNISYRDIEIPILGDHNIRNALSNIALASLLHIDISIAKNTLKNFTGVKRRFTKIGKFHDILAIDDYAHHPTEIKSVIDSAHQCKPGRIIIVHQPHRFKRLNQLFNEFTTCFDSANTIILLPVYKADDTEEGELNSNDLYSALKKIHKNVFLVDNKAELEECLNKLIKTYNENDIILFTGAGSISQMAHEIVCYNL